MILVILQMERQNAKYLPQCSAVLPFLSFDMTEFKEAETCGSWQKSDLIEWGSYDEDTRKIAPTCWNSHVLRFLWLQLLAT